MRSSSLHRLTAALSLLFMFGWGKGVATPEESAGTLPEPPDLSEESLQLWIRENPDNGLLEYLLAAHLFEQGRSQEALAHLQQGNRKPHCSTAPFLSSTKRSMLPEYSQASDVAITLLASLRKVARQGVGVAAEARQDGDYERAREILDGILTMGERTMSLHPPRVDKVLVGTAIKTLSLAELERLAQATQDPPLREAIAAERERLDYIHAQVNQFVEGMMTQASARMMVFLAPQVPLAPLPVELLFVLVLGILVGVRRPTEKGGGAWPRALKWYVFLFLGLGGMVASCFGITGWVSAGTQSQKWAVTAVVILVGVYGLLAPFVLHRIARRHQVPGKLPALAGFKLHVGAMLFLLLWLVLLCPAYHLRYRALPWQAHRVDLGILQDEEDLVTRLLTEKTEVLPAARD